MKAKGKKTNFDQTILVTDSGLGGLSIFAELVERLATFSPWDKVSMIYVNAWPEAGFGYNQLQDMGARATVFNYALKAMAGYHPDQILIACNTLSVIYPYTEFYTMTRIPVTGIIEHGVQQIYEHLITEPGSKVIIFGTPATVNEGPHKKKLIHLGINPEQIITQGCTRLAGTIEKSPFSNEVKAMINLNVEEAVSKLGTSESPVLAALCCTHFGYCRDLFQNALKSWIKTRTTILNPNTMMTEQVLENKKKTRNHPPEITIRIISKVKLMPDQVMAYTDLIRSRSPGVAVALETYEWNKHLFPTDL